VAELQYGKLPELEKRLKEAQDQEAGKAGVQAAPIACCAPRWARRKLPKWSSRATGIPVAKMMQGERDKLLQMEGKLHDRVVGQDEAIAGRVQRHPPFALGPVGPEPAYGFLPVPRPHRRGQDRAVQGAGRFLV